MLRVRGVWMGAIFLVACSSGSNLYQPKVAPAPPPASPAAALGDYLQALRMYGASVELLAQVPPSDDGRGVRQALNLLSDAVQRIPLLDSTAAVEAADLARSSWVQTGYAPEGTSPTEATKRSLTYVAAALRLAAATAGTHSQLDEQAAAMTAAVGAIDGTQPLTDQHDRIVRALEAARLALATIAQLAGSATTPIARHP